MNQVSKSRGGSRSNFSPRRMNLDPGRSKKRENAPGCASSKVMQCLHHRRRRAIKSLQERRPAQAKAHHFTYEMSHPRLQLQPQPWLSTKAFRVPALTHGIGRRATPSASRTATIRSSRAVARSQSDRRPLTTQTIQMLKAPLPLTSQQRDRINILVHLLATISRLRA